MIENGKILLTCGWCKKQFWADVVGSMTDPDWYMVDCDECSARMAEDVARREQEQITREREELRLRRLADAGIPADFATYNMALGNVNLSRNRSGFMAQQDQVKAGPFARLLLNYWSIAKLGYFLCVHLRYCAK